MDGQGRVFDNISVERLWRNVKYADVYPKGYATVGQLTIGLAPYFTLYNGERPQQALGNRTPAEVYRSGGRWRSVDRGPVSARGGACACSATLHRRFFHRTGNFNGHLNGHLNGNTGAAPSSCE